MSNKLNHATWGSARRAMAVESFCIDAADVMMPRADAYAEALARQAAADSNVDQGRPLVQSWRALERQMGNALIALEKMGYVLTPPSGTDEAT